MTQPTSTNRLVALIGGGVEHRITEAMASNWDEAGHRPPSNWRVSCACGWSERGLVDQLAAHDTWQRHAIEQLGSRP